MAPKVVTVEITEQQYESQVRASVLKAFPWLPADKITHQTTFSFKFGHATITVNGENKDSAKARSDILIFFSGTPLAVMELKRPTIRIDADDFEQGLSYARMLHPRPPLVVVTNGKDTQILETHSGAKWEPVNPSEKNLEALIGSATSGAKLDLKRAVGILMGSDPSIWIQAIRQATHSLIAERTGSWGDHLRPFVEDFLVPRQITADALELLAQRERLVLIEGSPLAGKSNVLRELAQQTADHPSLAVLYVDADPDVDVFESLSMILAQELNWPLTSDEAKQWLINLSRADGPALVVAIDNLGPDRGDLNRNIENLTSNLFGPAVRVVLAVDDGIAAQLVVAKNGRTISTIGNRAVRLSLGLLNFAEFVNALIVLDRHRVTIAAGGKHSENLRALWVLRAMAARAAVSPEYFDASLAAAFSPVPGLDLIGYARTQFDVTQSPMALYRELALAILADGRDADRPYQLKLELMEVFVVRRATAQEMLDGADLRAMRQAGLIRETRSASQENIFVVRLPELMASEMAKLLAEELPGRVQNDVAEAANWLAGAASNLPLGDVMAAQALIDAALDNKGLNIGIIGELVSRPPVRTTMKAGTRSAGWFAGVGVVNITLLDGGAMLIEHAGREERIEPDEGDPTEHVSYEDFTPYLILSHLAGHPFEAVGSDPALAQRMDPDLLLQVALCPVVLRRPGGDPDVAAILVHDITPDLTVVCHKAGIVEPITWSMAAYLGREPEEARDIFVQRALENADPALVARLDIALREVARTVDKSRALWASTVRNDVLQPLLERVLEGFH